MPNDLRIRAWLDDQISGKLAKIRDNFDRLGKSKGALSILQGVGMGAGISAWNMVGNAVSGAVDFMGQAIDSASNLREAMALSQQVFENNADAVQAWGETAADSFGMSQREALNFAATFGTAFKSVGMSLEDTTAKAEEMTKLAADLGSAFNASSEEAATALRAGLIGESEPMRRFGVFLSEAAVQAKALELGLVKAGAKLTDTQKVAARYAIIMEQTADSQGMFGRDSGSLADAQKELAAQFENLQAELGEGLLPVMVSLAQTLNDDVVPALKATLGAMDHFSWAMKYQRDNAEDLWFWQKGLLGLWTDGQQGAEAYAAAMEKLTYQVSDAAMEGAEAWDTYTEKNAAARAGLAASVKPADDTAAALNKVAKEAWDAGEMLDGMRQAWDDLDKELETKRRLADMPELIKVAAGDTKTAYDELRAAIKSGDKVAIAAATLRYREAKRNVADLRTEWQRLRAEMSAKIVVGRAASILSALGLHVHLPGEAEGGPVQAGRPYIVGEEGRELFVPRTDGRIIPNDELVQMGGTSVSGGLAPVNLAVYLDSEQIAARVERRQYFAASVAPASSR